MTDLSEIQSSLSVKLAGGDETYTTEVDQDKRLRIAQAVESATTGVLTITTTPQRICANGISNLTDRTFLRFQNLGGFSLYWSTNPSVSTSGANQGFELSNKAAESLQLSDAVSLYIVATGGSRTLIVMEGR